MSESLKTERPKLFLHLGTYKTGTTTLQGFFSIYQSLLLRKFGILYPNSSRRTNSGVVIPGCRKDSCFAHHILAHRARKALANETEASSFRSLIRSISDEFSSSGAHSMLLSTELLSSCDPKIRKRLVSRFKDFDIKVIYAVRHAADYVESMNNQKFKSGDGRPLKLKTLPFLKNINGWVESLGRENVHVLCFSPKRFSQFSREFMDVFGIAGLTDFAIDNLPRLNSGVSLEGVIVRKVLAEHLPPLQSLKPNQRHIITVMIGEIDQKLSQRTPLCTLSAKEREKIELSNEKHMREIIASFLNPEDTNYLLLSQGAPGVAKNLDQLVSFGESELKMIRSELQNCPKLLNKKTIDSVLDKLRTENQISLSAASGMDSDKVL